MKKATAIISIPIACLMMGFAGITGYKPGDVVKSFTLKNVDGKRISLDNYNKEKGVIIIFTCNHCPFAKLYQDRMNALDDLYATRGFPLLAISSNDAGAVPEDSFAQMVKRAREQHYSFPYLYDESQDVARAFGAVKTPQAYVLWRENGQWVLKYKGAIDDNGAEPDKVVHRYVAEAVEALLHHQPVPVAESKSVGCGIKWKN